MPPPKLTPTQRELRRLTKQPRPKGGAVADQWRREEVRAQREALEDCMAQQLRASPLVPGFARQFPFTFVEEVLPGIIQPGKGVFDFAIWFSEPHTRHEVKIAVEVEGGTWTNGRHTRGSGYAADCLKYNHASMQGWLLLRFTSDMLAGAYLTVERAIAGAFIKG